jgi:hypothetical protein
MAMLRSSIVTARLPIPETALNDQVDRRACQRLKAASAKLEARLNALEAARH